MHWPKSMFACLTLSQAISQSFSRFHHFQINERCEQVSLFFFIFGNSFLYKIIVSFTMLIKRSPGGESAAGGRSTSKSTCVVERPAFGNRPASSMSKFSASVNSDLGNGFFGSKSVTLSLWIDVVENIREFDRIN